MARRGNGEGCISKEPSGRYRILVSVWKDGKRTRYTRTAWKHAEAVAILEELRGEAASGSTVSPSQTLAQYLDEWLRLTVSANSAPNTLESYSLLVRIHIAPHIGHHPLRKLTSRIVKQWLEDMATKQIGSSTREHAFIVLRAALNDANFTAPLLKVRKPKHVSKDVHPFTIEEANRILHESKGSRWHAMIVLGITAGLRTGELLGLHRNQIDFKAGSIHVKQQAIEIKGVRSIAPPKSKASIRTVNLIPLATEALRAQLELLKRDGLEKSALIFPAPKGGIESRANFRQRVWLPILKKLKIKARGFHHARHTYATHALANKIPVAVVSKQIGHSKTSVTYDTYSHSIPDHQVEAVETLSRLFQ